jgi:hypothetical protein
MSLISLLLALACSGTTGFVALGTIDRSRRLNRLEIDVDRALAEQAERARFVAARESISLRTGIAPAEVDNPVAVAAASHEAIAAIPFGILEAIPVTAETTKVVRQVHDEIAGTVYDAINLAAKGIGAVFRKQPQDGNGLGT